MRKFIVLIFGFLCCCNLVTSDYYEDEFTDYVPFIGLRRDEFDWKLLKTLVENDQSNFIVSPFSIKVILMLLAEMSTQNSKTQKELFTALDDIKNMSEGRMLYKNYLKSLLSKSDTENDIRWGSIVVVSDKLQTSKRLERIYERDYFASINGTDLTDEVGATQKINDWVAELTSYRIQNLVSKDAIADTVVMLLNALYFDGHWKSPFKTEKTTRGPFMMKGSRSSVDYMTDTGDYYYFQSDRLRSKILRLPYSGRKYAMFVILPNEDQTIQSIVPLFDHKTINREAWYLDEHTVNVKLPKFNIDYSADLKPYLNALGINTIFTNEASLTGLPRGIQPTSSQLLVSNIIQKTAIDVNEEGSTAAAATQGQLVNKIDEGIKEFHANRPFIFYIEDETTGNIIFAGQVADPSLRS